jgi:hypothetical protein
VLGVFGRDRNSQLGVQLMAEPTNRRLDSWKEIADYLGRDVRTAIRWEKEKALPVRRVPGGKRQGVFAYSGDIDQWMSGQNVALEPVASADGSETIAGAGPQDFPRARRVSRLRIAFSIAAVFVVLLATAWLWIERNTSAAAGPPPLQRPLHFARADYEAGAPRGLVAGDFNGDKKVDLAFTDSLQGKVIVLLGDGYGSFPRRVLSPTAGKVPERLALGDFNGDGQLDVAVTSYFGGTEIEVLLGKGDGSFRAQFQHEVGGRSRWIAAGDLNRDGKLDVAVAASVASQVIILFGNGDGTFREGARYEAERDVATLVLADMNGDGALDIVANDYRSAMGKSVSIYVNRGDATFRARESFPAGNGPLGLAVADLNNDGRPDVVTANFPVKAFILYGSGAMNFGEPLLLDAGQGNGFVEVADVDRDGALDLVILGEHSDTATLLMGDGRGGFLHEKDIPTGEYPDGAVVADFDADGKPDMAILNINGNSISVFLNRATEAPSSRRWLARLTSFWSN